MNERPNKWKENVLIDKEKHKREWLGKDRAIFVKRKGKMNTGKSKGDSNV